MERMIERRGLRDATPPEYCSIAILLYPTQTPKRGSTCGPAAFCFNDSATSTSEARKRNDFARSGQVFFDERSDTFVTLAVESFGRLGKERRELIDQLAASTA